MSSKISDLAIEVRDAYVPNKEDDLSYIGLEHVEQGTLHISSIGSSQEVKSHKFRFKSGDILFGTLRPYFRKVIVAPCDGVCSTEFCVVRPKEPEDRYFVFYGMAHQQFIKYATTNSKGARPRTKWKLFSDFQLPDFLPSQRRDIGKILFTYNDLIENNRRRIQLLEQAVRLLYREWFVHLRFPGHEHVKINDGVPEGWKKVLMGDFIRFANGKAMKSGQEGEYPVYGSNGIIGRSEEYRHENGIIIGRVGAYCGSIEICRGRFWPSDNTIVATMLGEPIEIPYLFHMLKHMDLNRFAGGAAQPLLTQSNLKGLLVVVPTPTLRLEFNQFAEEIFAQVDCLVESNSQLTQARDLLLPRLMNGEVPV